MMRKASLERNTEETQIKGAFVIEGGLCAETRTIQTGIGFLDHMLTLFEKHGGFWLNLQAEGDLGVDCHHTAEDTGILIGKLIREAAGDCRGICRYGSSTVPMDEALAQVHVDFGGRPFLVFHAELPRVKIGDFDAEMTEDFFRALAFQCGMTLHINVAYGRNAHHIVEGIFKAFARALRQALTVDPELNGVLSTKGCFD